MSGAFNNDGRGISPLIATSWERCNKLMKRETWNVPHQAQGQLRQGLGMNCKDKIYISQNQQRKYMRKLQRIKYNLHIFHSLSLSV